MVNINFIRKRLWLRLTPTSTPTCYKWSTSSVSITMIYLETFYLPLLFINFHQSILSYKNFPFLLFMLSYIAFVLHFIMFCIIFFLTLHYFLLCICFNIVFFLLFITFFPKIFRITSYSLFFFLIINSYLFFILSFRTFPSFILWLFCLDVTTTLDLTRSKNYSNW